MGNVTVRRSPRAARPGGSSRDSRSRPAGRARLFVAGLVAGLAISAVVAGVVVAVRSSHGSGDPKHRRAAQIAAADKARDARQIVQLTTLARRTADRLVPVVKGITAQPALAGPARVAGWTAATTRAAADFAHPPSGETATNVARGGLRAAVDQLQQAVETYAAAGDAGGAERAKLLTLAARERDTAVLTWSVAATQLDAINVTAGHGHAHIYLPATTGSGAFTADDAPEGGK